MDEEWLQKAEFLLWLAIVVAAMVLPSLFRFPRANY